jgi:gamma-glutamylputrescine oxidase
MTSGHIDSYYSRSQAYDLRYAPLEGEVEAEVCVIGGGLAGLATALGLAERGIKTALLEARRIAWGASGRNGGFVSPGFSLGVDSLVKRVGLDRATALYRLTREAMTLIRSRIDRFAIPCDPVEGVVIASWFDDRAAMERAAAFRRERLAEDAIFWPRETLRDHYRSRRYYDGILLADSFHMHPLNFAAGIAAAAARTGAALHEDSAVTDHRARGNLQIVETARGRVAAEQVVYCCSGYIHGLEPRLSRATLPVGTYVLLTEPLGERLRDAIRAPHALADTRFASDYYRPLGDGRLLWGGRVGAFGPPANLAQVMLGDLLKVYPQLAGLRAEVAWPGTMGYATHKMPQIGRLRPGVWYNMGYGGHGLCSTTMGGELVAAAIADGDERYRLFAPFGLSYAGGPLAAVIAQTAYWSYQLGDALRR